MSEAADAQAAKLAARVGGGELKVISAVLLQLDDVRRDRDAAERRIGVLEQRLKGADERAARAGPAGRSAQAGGVLRKVDQNVPNQSAPAKHKSAPDVPAAHELRRDLERSERSLRQVTAENAALTAELHRSSHAQEAKVKDLESALLSARERVIELESESRTLRTLPSETASAAMRSDYDRLEREHASLTTQLESVRNAREQDRASHLEETQHLQRTLAAEMKKAETFGKKARQSEAALETMRKQHAKASTASAEEVERAASERTKAERALSDAVAKLQRATGTRAADLDKLVAAVENQKKLRAKEVARVDQAVAATEYELVALNDAVRRLTEVVLKISDGEGTPAAPRESDASRSDAERNCWKMTAQMNQATRRCHDVAGACAKHQEEVEAGLKAYEASVSRALKDDSTSLVDDEKAAAKRFDAVVGALFGMVRASAGVCRKPLNLHEKLDLDRLRGVFRALWQRNSTLTAANDRLRSDLEAEARRAATAGEEAQKAVAERAEVVQALEAAEAVQKEVLPEIDRLESAKAEGEAEIRRLAARAARLEEELENCNTEADVRGFEKQSLVARVREAEDEAKRWASAVEQFEQDHLRQRGVDVAVQAEATPAELLQLKRQLAEAFAEKERVEDDMKCFVDQLAAVSLKQKGHQALLDAASEKLAAKDRELSKHRTHTSVALSEYRLLQSLVSCPEEFSRIDDKCEVARHDLVVDFEAVTGYRIVKNNSTPVEMEEKAKAMAEFVSRLCDISRRLGKQPKVPGKGGADKSLLTASGAAPVIRGKGKRGNVAPEVRALDEENLHLRHELSLLGETLEGVRKDRDRAKRGLLDSEDAAKAREEETARVRSKLTALEKTLEGVAQDRDEAERGLIAAEHTAKVLEEEARRARSEARSLEDRLTDANDALQKAELLVQVTTQAAQDDSKLLQKRLQQLDAERDEAEAELRAERDLRQSIESDSTRAHEEAHRLRQLLKRAELEKDRAVERRALQCKTANALEKTASVTVTEADLLRLPTGDLSTGARRKEMLTSSEPLPLRGAGSKDRAAASARAPSIGDVFVTDKIGRNAGNWAVYFATITNVVGDAVTFVQVDGTFTLDEVRRLVETGRLYFHSHLLTCDELQAWVATWREKEMEAGRLPERLSSHVSQRESSEPGCLLKPPVP
ncbi:hypothetical protein DIPPA_23618 [Diplonema papillatum]|nr:hypothetical protein DIPPA_23618 [Diplonema papillatum]|eukprot:gene3949-6116_t